MAGGITDFLTQEQMEILEGTLEPEETKHQGACYVKITEDKMEAWLYLEEPEDGVPYTKDGLIAYLNENGVTEGLHTSNIAAMAKKQIYGREVKVAIGTKPEAGKPGYYEFYFEPGDLSKAPQIRPDGSVDYTSMKQLQNIRKGEAVALYHPAIPGQDGILVDGKEVKAALARDLPPLSGRGVIRDEEDPNLFRANMDGKIQIIDNKVDIQSVHEVPEDVDMLTGKVEFFGDIVISGNVSAGVVIRAGRNLTIDGTVEGCTLYAGGDIVLKRGVQGGGKANITAKGSVYAEFLEYAEVKAGRNVQANAILNSNVNADGKVTLNGKKGVLIGGQVHGLEGIDAQTLGNDVEVKTFVHCGIPEEQLNRLNELRRQEQDTKRTLNEVVESMKETLKKRKGSESEHAQRQIEQSLCLLNEQKDRLFAKLDEIKQEKDQLTAVFEKGRDAAIVIRGKINRGSVISIETERMVVEKGTSFTKYTLKYGVIDGEVVAI